MWSAGLPPAGATEWGVYFDVALRKPDDDLSTPGFSFILHQGDYKESTGLIYQLDLSSPIAATAWVVEGRKQVDCFDFRNAHDVVLLSIFLRDAM